MSRLTDARTRPVGHRIQTTRSTPVPVDAGRRRFADALTARIASAKRRLLTGGLLRSIEWGIPGDRDVRGRQTITWSMLDAFIEQRPALDRSTFTTERADDTVLTILEPLAITDAHFFRWGEHTYRISKVDGIVKDEVTGTRFFSEVFVLR